MVSGVLILFLSMSGITQAADWIGMANKEDSTASFINLKTKAKYTVPVGYMPHEIVATDTHAFVSNYGHHHVRSSSLEDSPGNTITVIDLSNFKIKKSINLGVGKCAPHGMAVSQNQKVLVVTCEGRQEIAVINVKKLEVSHFIRTNQPGSHILVISGDRVYVTNFWIGTITAINLKTNSIIKQIKVGRTIEGIDVGPEGKFLFATIVESNEIVKVNAENLEVDQRVTVGDSPIRIKATKAGILVVNFAGSNSVGIFDSVNLKLVKKIKVGNLPIGLSLSKNGDRAFVANMKSNSISILNLDILQIESTIPTLTNSPDGIVFIKK